MSEFLAEARILVRPDTSRFRAELEAQLANATKKPIRVPVVPVVAGSIGGATAQTNAFTAAQSQAAAQTQAVAAAIEKETIDLTRLTGAQAVHNKQLSQLGRGAGSAGLTLFGLRGATLAASGAFLAGTAAVAAFSKSVQSAAKLQTELNVFRVTAAATADEMRRAAEEAQRLGQDLTLPGVTAGDAAEAMTQLAKSGLDVRNSLGAVKGTLQLATAAQIDNVAATGLVASALNSFALSGGQAVRVADLLTGAAKESQAEITDMGTALQQASAVAKLAGVNIEDTVTFLTQLARAGLSGGRAGTSLRVAMLRLINPTEQAAAKLKELEINLRDAQGNLKASVFTDIAAALEGLTRAQQQATLATIFGTDAVRAAAIIGGQGAVAFESLRDSVTEQGLAAEQAEARTAGFAGSVENLKNQFEGLGTTLGGTTLTPLGALADFFANIAKQSNLLIQAIKNLKGELTGFEGDDERVQKITGSFFDFAEAVNVTRFTIGSLNRAGILVNGGDGPKNTKTQLQGVTEEIEKIFALGRSTGGELGLNETLVQLDALVEKLKQGGPEAEAFANAVQKVRDNLADNKSKVSLFPTDIRDLFPPELQQGIRAAADKAAKTTQEAFVSSMRGIGGSSLYNAMFDVLYPIVNAIDEVGKTASEKARLIVTQIVASATNELAKLDEAFDVAAAAGNQKGQLASLRQQAAEQERIRAAADKAAKDIGAGNKGFATAVATRRKAQKALAAINAQIEGIESQIASDAKQAAAAAKQRADDAQRARDDRDRAFLEAIGLKETGLQNKVLAAATTEALNNDIARNKNLRAFYKRAREEAAKTIIDAALRLKTVQGFTADIIRVTKTISELEKQQAEAIKAARQKTFDTIQQSAQLDIDFFSAKENRSGELKAREALIASLRKEQALVKRGTVEWKKLRNDIAEQQKAIDEITNVKKESNRSFAQATFEFLQSQQGFASNLLGNLIPQGATAGLVGGGGAVQGALNPQAAFSDGQGKSTPTSGQVQTTNAVLLRILDQMKILNGSRAAPEAWNQYAAQNAVQDGVGGG